MGTDAYGRCRLDKAYTLRAAREIRIEAMWARGHKYQSYVNCATSSRTHPQTSKTRLMVYLSHPALCRGCGRNHKTVPST